MLNYLKFKNICDERWTENGVFDVDWFIHNYELVVSNDYKGYTLAKSNKSMETIIGGTLRVLATIEVNLIPRKGWFDKYFDEYGVKEEVYERIEASIEEIRRTL